MDTSSEYVKMCKQAVEIQKLWGKNEGDFIFIGALNRIGVHGIDNYYHSDGQSSGGYVASDYTFLPRQDQLQPMLSEYYFELFGCYKDQSPKEYMLMISDGADSIVAKGETLEQVWLKAVMGKKHGKVWNGTDWE